MVHTAQFYCELSSDDIRKMMLKHNMGVNLIPSKLEEDFYGFSGAIIKEYNYYKFYLTVDFIKILNKTDITENDYDNIEKSIDLYMSKLCDLLCNDLTLTRLDYRLDVKFNNKKEREILIKLYRKLINKRGFKRKSLEEKTSIYYNTKSSVCCIYDKEKEAIDKRGIVQPFEENTIRFEYRLYNRHLNNNKYAKKMDKSLKTYLRDELFIEYMSKNIEPLIYKGDYYKIYRAETIINQSTLNQKDKVILIEFLTKVSKRGITKVKNTIDDDGNLVYTKYKFKKITSQLEKLGINPVLIPKNSDGPSSISNPFQLYINRTNVKKTA
ncbi:phage/plasmid replication protein [Clostridium sp.]|uniref:phage/plasmid replication domain-containing protein n=1 Tax=Clostridium sp. TaxID=1506 RepID=UPI0028429652|nr:phage/plasmid replication protein [Clostridium sp.]MDR3598712.1 hypothetical protein [Clostridium sp.]